MIHHRQGLALSLKSGNDAFRVHPQLDDFDSNAPADRLLLLGHVDDAAAAFADFLEQLVAPEHVAGLFLAGSREGGRFGREIARR